MPPRRLQLSRLEYHCRHHVSKNNPQSPFSIAHLSSIHKNVKPYFIRYILAELFYLQLFYVELWLLGISRHTWTETEISHRNYDRCKTDYYSNKLKLLNFFKTFSDGYFIFHRNKLNGFLGDAFSHASWGPVYYRRLK